MTKSEIRQMDLYARSVTHEDDNGMASKAVQAVFPEASLMQVTRSVNKAKARLAKKKEAKPAAE